MAITHTEFSTMDVPDSLQSGTVKRRKIVIFRGTSSSTGDTFEIASAEPNSADVEGILWHTANGAAIIPTFQSEVASWSTNTVTVGTVGVNEMGIMVNLT